MGNLFRRNAGAETLFHEFLADVVKRMSKVCQDGADALAEVGAKVKPCQSSE